MPNDIFARSLGARVERSPAMPRAASVVLWLLMAIAATSLLVPPLSAQATAPEASALARNLMSPFCPGLLLADCRSDRARELRAEIARRLKAGETAAALEADLIARFGPEIRAVPEFRGLGLLAWMGPALVGAGGFAFLVVTIRKATGWHTIRERRAEDAETDEDPATLERLQEELDDLD